MPIRMTDDDPSDPSDPSEEDDDTGGKRPGGGKSGDGGGGGGGPSGLQIVSIIAALVFFWRHPKLSIVLLVIVGVLVFALASSGPSGPKGGQRGTPVANNNDRPGTGATLDPKVYDQTLVHEPISEEGLPIRASLLAWAPPRKSQGKQGSCVGWATSYAARSILHAKERDQRPATVAFSPSFTYNQIALNDCNGTYLKKALDLLERTGDLPLNDFAYTDQSCTHTPSTDEKQRASQYRIAGYARLTEGSEDQRTNPLALKQHLAQGGPVVVGMKVGGTFESLHGQRVWHPTRADWNFEGTWGGHAMAVIGYDDTVEGGAFQIMNSWGPRWGEDGVAFVRYKDFEHFVKEAYGIYPRNRQAAGTTQRIRFGLVETGTHKHIPLAPVSGITFRTVRPIAKGTRFKVELNNTSPVYAYLFGQETDGSSYVLFPYTAKHSPYCGTTGTRIFPRKQSLTADNIGTRDSVAVVISPNAIDFKALNARIKAARGTSYAKKLVAALGMAEKSSARVDSGAGVVELSAAVDKVHALVLEFDKR
jgi:hypothetical protein